MLYSWCDTESFSFFTNSLPLIDPKILNIELSVQSLIFHCSIVQSVNVLVHWSLLTLFCFLNNGFLAILPYRLASQSLLLTVDIDTLFSQDWFSYAVMFGVVSLLSCKPVTLIKLSFAPVVAFGLPVLLWVLLCPVSWCLLTVEFTVVQRIFIFSTKEEKCLQINFSKNICLYWGWTYWRRLVISMINKNIVVHKLFHQK